jgi:hypothetical protein
MLRLPTAAPGGPGCEQVTDGLLAEPVSAWTSLAFVVAGALVLLHARRDTGLRRHLGPALALLALGGAIGTLSRARRPRCDPTSLLQGHAAWHALAAAALVVLAPTVGTRGARADAA